MYILVPYKFEQIWLMFWFLFWVRNLVVLFIFHTTIHCRINSTRKKTPEKQRKRVVLEVDVVYFLIT